MKKGRLDRRSFLALTALSAASAPFPAVSLAHTVRENPVRAAPTPQQYMVGDSACCCDWRWGGLPVWRMGSKEYSQWYDDGPLTEEGRSMLLEHFHLASIREKLTIDVIERMSPADLCETRRKFEAQSGEAPAAVGPSDRHGGRIKPELCC